MAGTLCCCRERHGCTAGLHVERHCRQHSHSSRRTDTPPPPSPTLSSSRPRHAPRNHAPPDPGGAGASAAMPQAGRWGGEVDPAPELLVEARRDSISKPAGGASRQAAAGQPACPLGPQPASLQRRSARQGAPAAGCADRQGPAACRQRAPAARARRRRAPPLQRAVAGVASACEVLLVELHARSSITVVPTGV